MILDHAGNALRHGLPCEEREWSLDGIEKDAKEAGERSTEKQCEECFFVHLPAPACPNCGHVYKVKARKVEELQGELEEMDAATLKRKRAFEQTSGQLQGSRRAGQAARIPEPRGVGATRIQCENSQEDDGSMTMPSMLKICLAST